MNYLFSMLAVLVAGMFILMAGIMMNREPGQSLLSAVKDSVVWGAGFFLTFGTEFLMLANV
jgi:hypothetical protein